MASTQPRLLLVVRGLKSKLPKAELERRLKQRMPEFEKLEGLVQKYYAYDETTDEWAGIYLWASERALAAYMESDLRKSIASAYDLIEAPRIERYPIVDVLRSIEGDDSASS
jgi:heme-degrading monooxygenase HmoA